MKSNIQLVKHAEMALKEKWGYVWGTFGQVLTPTLLNQKIKQYPSGVGNYQSFINQNWLNKRSVDCIGLIKSFVWWNGGNVKYNPSQDKNADMTYNQAKVKGPLSTLPEIPGIILYKKGHVGVYIGSGTVIEARGTKVGVIKSPLKGNGSAGWTHWLKSPYINYNQKVIVESEKLPKGKVKINLLGKNILVDGYIKDNTNYILVNGSYIPIRIIFESMGLNVSWDNGVVVK